MKTYELIEQALNSIRNTVELMEFSAEYPIPVGEQHMKRSMRDYAALLKQTFTALELAAILIKEGKEDVL